MHSWIEISKSALSHNLKTLKEQSSTPLAPVLKSNAYGHGLKEVFAAIAEEEYKLVCLNYCSEGEELRKLGYKGRILIVGPTLKEDFKLAIEHSLELTIGHLDILNTWSLSPSKPKIHVKIDTGMSRQGLFPNELKAILPTLLKNRNLVIGLSTHFANVEDLTNQVFAESQLANFEQAKSELIKAGLNLEVHSASSASTLLLPKSRYDYCRVGISLYGFWPSTATKLSFLKQEVNLPNLKRVLSWKSKLTSVKTVPKDSYVGYGCTFRTSKPLQLGVVSCGYYEGFPRIAGQRGGYVLVKGARCPIVGRICMNMMIVDLSAAPMAEIGDTVVLIGTDGPEEILAENLADWAESIHYEVTTRLNSAIPRCTVH